MEKIIWIKMNIKKKYNKNKIIKLNIKAKKHEIKLK